jgi:hypothetical protein
MSAERLACTVDPRLRVRQAHGVILSLVADVDVAQLRGADR